ncbi:ABC transporter permease subunit [Telmatospirillum sp.]|uniref:ABC transporter permease n=1 Tax=Telmatospirillum sp. TaxID=2079197 RepID=UPI0028483560|nr:ABC transporter permease subunit [Telmatospirillum sp.]MDR3440754.1 ABC transporter permease subunit [Telmatospirillum sp.]
MLPLALAILWVLAFGSAQMTTPYNIGDPLPISLDPGELPYYLMRSFLRMAAGLVFSLLFTLVYATLAAKSRYAEKILIPLLDVLQSIPILGFLSITVTGFIALFPGNLLGVECASIFAIFTSQAWNMTFSFYASLRTVPHDLEEAAAMFHLSIWQRFWQLELPFAAPSLIWNMMMSVSGGWFFVVASEAITVNSQTITLPGIGSYIAMAIAEKDLSAIGWAILAMLIGIVLYDQLLFRPLVAWADKFKFESLPGEEIPTSRLLDVLQRAKLVRALGAIPAFFWEWSLVLFHKRTDGLSKSGEKSFRLPWFDRLWTVFLLGLAAFAVYRIGDYVRAEVGLDEVLHVFLLGLITAVRVIVLIAIAAAIWVPVGVWIGFRPRIAQTVQPIAQFMAAFPANLMFPVAVILILHFNASVEIWTSPLMILGTQWYILFNVISGAMSMPSDFRAVADNLGLKGWLRWKRMILPGIFPSFVTGAITASGGSWNASIVSEMVSWGDTTLMATGIGSYIADNTQKGDFPRIALGVAVMCCYVMLFNRQVWRRMYRLAEERLRID